MMPSTKAPVQRKSRRKSAEKNARKRYNSTTERRKSACVSTTRELTSRLLPHSKAVRKRRIKVIITIIITTAEATMAETSRAEERTATRTRIASRSQSR